MFLVSFVLEFFFVKSLFSFNKEVKKETTKEEIRDTRYNKKKEADWIDKKRFSRYYKNAEVFKTKKSRIKTKAKNKKAYGGCLGIQER